MKNSMQNNERNTTQEYLGEYFGQVRQILFFLLIWGIVVIANFCLLGNISKIPSFLFGYAASAIYYLLMCSRIKKLSGMKTSQAVSYMQNGWAIRLSFIAAAAIIALKLPWVNFGAAAVGLFSAQIVMALQAVVIVTKGLFAKYK